MTGGPSADRGESVSGLPWALVFDPAVNVRALGEIQARGFRAASELVDRFVTISERGAPPQADPADAERPTNPDGERLVQSWRAIVGQLIESMRVGMGPSRGQAAAFDFAGPRATGQLELTADPSGTATAEVWLHNMGPTDLGSVALRCGELTSADGGVVGAARVHFDPERVPMPPRCSRGVLVHIDVADVVVGRYLGTLLVDGHPDIWLSVLLTVGADPR